MEENTWREDDWSWWKPDEKVSYPLIHGGSDDEAVEVEGQSYEAEEFYCVTPGCDCHEIDVVFFEVETERLVGTVRVDVRSGDELGGSSEADGDAELVVELFREFRSQPCGEPERLQRRRQEMRELGPEIERLAKRDRPVRHKKIGPNERCPCGSGKKYKFCCQ